MNERAIKKEGAKIFLYRLTPLGTEIAMTTRVYMPPAAEVDIPRGISP